MMRGMIGWICSIIFWSGNSSTTLTLRYWLRSLLELERLTSTSGRSTNTAGLPGTCETFASSS